MKFLMWYHYNATNADKKTWLQIIHDYKWNYIPLRLLTRNFKCLKKLRWTSVDRNRISVLHRLQ